MTRIRADFNSIDEHGLVRSRTNRADGELTIGAVVVVFDADGLEAKASVHSVEENGLVRLNIDPVTFSEQQVRFTDLPPGSVVIDGRLYGFPSAGPNTAIADELVRNVVTT